MRVAVISPYALDIPGGVQQQVLGLVEHLQRQGEEAFAVGPGAGSGAAAANAGRPVMFPVNRSRAPIALSPVAFRRVRTAVAGADVIHVHEPMVPLVGWAALRTGRPTVVTFHADPSPAFRAAYRWGRGLVRLLLGDVVATAVSRTARSAVEGLGLDLVEIPNAVNVASFRVEARRDPRRVAFVGRPDPRKGRDLLLSAWPVVRSEVPDARLVVVGGGESPPTEGVEFLGRVSEAEKRSVLAGSGVFCAPNRGGESFGITVAEGMAAGCAVVASDLPAFEDVLGGTGLMFRNGDPAALAGTLKAVLADPGMRERLAEGSSARVERYDWGRVISRYVELYRLATRAG
ncbi:MAG: glycosyltransferase family 4 protein [bacterium]|nr:glycosyltransferase family 4 protein [bacterium]MDE0352961.1 glycosyltransferase family 4 protein [bacterium]